MPQFSKLPVIDLDRYFLKRGQMDLTEYENYLSGLKSGDASEVRVGEGETQRAVKRRLTVAAMGQGKQLQYSRRAESGVIVFRVK